MTVALVASGGNETNERLVVELNGAVDFDGDYSLRGRSVYRDSATALRLEVRGRVAAA